MMFLVDVRPIDQNVGVLVEQCVFSSSVRMVICKLVHFGKFGKTDEFCAMLLPSGGFVHCLMAVDLAAIFEILTIKEV